MVIFQKVYFLFYIFFGEFGKNVLSFNPSLTYTIRIHKMTFIQNMTGNFTIDVYREKQFVSGYLKKDSDKLINKAIITFNRCNQDDINCEYFQSWTMTDLCKIVKEKNQLWSRWYQSFTPPIACPFDKAYYKFTNATLDIGVVLAFYPRFTEYGWKVYQYFYVNDTFVGGYGVHATIFGYRKKNQTKLKIIIQLIKT